MWHLPLLILNLVLSLSMLKKALSRAQTFLKWATNKTPQNSKVTTENSIADGIINNKVQQKRSKAMDMIFYWVKDRAEQDQFDVGWAPDDTNMGDYFTMHHSPAHHKRIRAY
jgi:hypothetical protein